MVSLVSPEQCLKEDALIATTQEKGLEEVRIIQAITGDYLMNVKVKSKEAYYLSTVRNQNRPRTFKSIDPAYHLATKLFGSTCRVLITTDHSDCI